MAVSISLSGQITISDGSSGAVSLQKQVSAMMVAGSSFNQATVSVGVASTSLVLPITPIQFAYFKNLHAIQTVNVTWTTPVGGSATVLTLEPGAVLVVNETNPGGGITAISLQASGASTPVEYILGG
jgi:hypothetical protein